MLNNQTNSIPSRSQAVALLAQKFIRDYEDAIKTYDIAQKLELTDHLIDALELMSQFAETSDNAIWENIGRKKKRF